MCDYISFGGLQQCGSLNVGTETCLNICLCIFVNIVKPLLTVLHAYDRGKWRSGRCLHHEIAFNRKGIRRQLIGMLTHAAKLLGGRDVLT